MAERQWNLDDKDLAIIAISILGAIGMGVTAWIRKDPTTIIQGAITAVAALGTGRKMLTAAGAPPADDTSAQSKQKEGPAT